MQKFFWLERMDLNEWIVQKMFFGSIIKYIRRSFL